MSRIQSSVLSGIKVASSAPVVSHLLFADDSLLFFKANRESAEAIKEALNNYCRASGQQVNMDKSSIHFAKGVGGSIREEIKVLLDVHTKALVKSISACQLMLAHLRMEHSNISKTGSGNGCKVG